MNLNYKKLCKIQEKIYKLSHAKSVLNWDQATMMSLRGNAERSKSIAEISTMIHELSTQKKIAKLISGSEKEDLNEFEISNLKEIKRDWLRKKIVPRKLVKKKQIAESMCEHEWRSQRKNNDWKGFLANFSNVVKISQEEANLLSQNFGISPYESLMEKYEPGLKIEEVDNLFNSIKEWLPNLITKICAKQTKLKVVPFKSDFNAKKQRKLCLEIMDLLGFDFKRGRLDTSAHPFCGGVRDDIRITTRFSKDTFLQSLFGTIHETGHARYEQNLPNTFYNQPIGRSRSMSIHESQALFFEKQIGCSTSFIKRITPIVQKYFGDKLEFSEVNICNVVKSVKPSTIRVDADEVTYPAHILLRYEIEKELINRTINTEDIPMLWDQKMLDYLGLNTLSDYENGVLQDIHWPSGKFGYFPCYTLGAMYASQWKHYISKSMNDIDETIHSGDIETIFTWLKENIWNKGSIYDTETLTKLACDGEGLNSNYYRNHLETRYLV